MKRKVKFEHPRILSQERMEQPVFPDVGDEIFQNGVFFFNVSAILKWLERNPQPIVCVPTDIWGSFPYKADCYVEEADLKRNALIVYFFAGSGTTLHAVNLLNTEDGGSRRCIMVTNNEVSDDEAKRLTTHGIQPGDPEWEKLGIARYVTWPRTVCSIEGHDINGKPLKGNYLGSDRPMADGFQANAAFFKLGFLDKNAIALGRQFREMLPTLWMKAGACGPCPVLDGDEMPAMLVLPENRFAVLIEESAFTAFEDAIREHPQISTIYIVTDYEAGYRAMSRSFEGKQTYQLYRDYLDNFRINTGRN